MLQANIDIANATAIDASAIPDALFDRGMYWASGRCGIVDLVAAHKWFNLAAVKGRADAIAFRREVAAQMSESEIASAQRAARDWMTTH
jgi:TPR repeat protein